jgi:hypothetical protein
VHDNPYVEVTDAGGRLRIDEVPPGTYDYIIWHEKLGEKKGKVTVETGKAAAITVEYSGS